MDRQELQLLSFPVIHDFHFLGDLGKSPIAFRHSGNKPEQFPHVFSFQSNHLQHIIKRKHSQDVSFRQFSCRKSGPDSPRIGQAEIHFHLQSSGFPLQCIRHQVT